MQFKSIVVQEEVWNFEHLKSFSFPYTIATAGTAVDLHIDVVFSCHCFTRSRSTDDLLPVAEFVYRTENEVRILDRERYQLSRALLPGLIKDFDARKILFASSENYMTIEATNANGVAGHYQVFFTVKRREDVKRRLTLLIQSAYFVEYLHRQAKPTSKRPVRFKVIATAAYERRKLRVGR